MAVSLFLVGCGAEAGEGTGTLGTGSSASADEDRGALPPGPALPDDAQVSPDELIISIEGGDAAAAEQAVRRAGGSVHDLDERIGVLVARFTVDGLAQLLEIRDELRAQGIDAAVNPVIEDPTAD